MRQKPGTRKSHGEKVIKDTRRVTLNQCSAEDKIWIVLDGLKGEDSIAELCRRERIAKSPYYSWSKEFLEAAKRRLIKPAISLCNRWRRFTRAVRAWSHLNHVE